MNRPTLFFLLLVLLGVSSHAVEIRMGVKPGLKFDVAGFHAKPGEKVKLIFSNNDEMMHNIVLGQPGKRLEIVESAIALGAEGLAKHFVPELPAVLASTPIVMPGEQFTLDFMAPAESGEYPYVCTFPGHGFVMYGILFVAKDRPAALDALLKKSAEKPEALQSELPLSKAKLERTFMPDCSPAAIAVALPGGHAYCWDAGNSRLRYAWRDGFIQKNGSYGRWRTLPTILGSIYHRELELPFRFAGTEDEIPSTKFLGYRLVDGIPEFRYRLGDCEVREFLAKLPGKSGLLRRFTISGLKGGLLYRKDPLAGVEIKASSGTWKGHVLHLNIKEAASFTLEMIEVPNKAPVEYWSMNDLSRSYSRKGSLVEGHRGRAWQFKSSTVISTPHVFSDFKEGGTVSFWIRAQNPDGNLPTICGWGEAGQGPTVSYEGRGRGLFLGIPKNEPEPREEPVLDKEWHHVVVSHGMSEACFYLDGKLIRKESFETKAFSDDAKFYIGQKVKSGAFLLDEVYLYGRPLSESEVRELANR